MLANDGGVFLLCNKYVIILKLKVLTLTSVRGGRGGGGGHSKSTGPEAFI